MVQEQYEYLTEKLENTSYVTSSLYTESWLRSFLSFIERNGEFLNATIDTEEDFIAALKQVRRTATYCEWRWFLFRILFGSSVALAVSGQSILAGCEIQREWHTNCGVPHLDPGRQHNRYESREGDGA